MKSQVEKSCGKQELLVAYLYHEASAAERAEFERHQASCASCHDELQAFTGVRQELRAWEMPFVPHIEVVTPRTVLDALRDVFRLLPTWGKFATGLGTAAAAALVLFAATSTHLRFGQGGFDARFNVKESTPVAAPPTTPGNALSRAEAEQMIQAAVAQAQAQAQQQTQRQLASLAAQLQASHQAELQTATLRLRKVHQKELSAQLARLDNGQRQTLTEWLFETSSTNNAGNTNNER